MSVLAFAPGRLAGSSLLLALLLLPPDSLARPICATDRGLRRAAILVSPATLGGVGFAIWPAFVAAMSATRSRCPIANVSCQTISGIVPLATLPPGRVMAPIDLVRIAPQGLAARPGEAPDYLEPVEAMSKFGWTVWRVRK
ncbi:hypothetical protein [Bradyrhizobium sp. I71]|uniref:hypothetical protein n=1 Tax=Bradyrhizobium sp. I71 TaxID=2590772 RepID=UPI001EF87394|nr:hypothetical protein [Bradyrhizobium sp. I71]ULL00338.1 hypothetical protein FJV43_11580 [Bradyrhizobium sp. I71]